MSCLRSVQDKNFTYLFFPLQVLRVLKFDFLILQWLYNLLQLVVSKLTLSFSLWKCVKFREFHKLEWSSIEHNFDRHLNKARNMRNNRQEMLPNYRSKIFLILTSEIGNTTIFVIYDKWAISIFDASAVCKKLSQIYMVYSFSCNISLE